LNTARIVKGLIHFFVALQRALYSPFHVRFKSFGAVYFLVLLVNDSEYSKSAGAKPILLLAVFISFPLARCAPHHPTPPPFFKGGGKYQKKNRL
jgi:hypothetical protein